MFPMGRLAYDAMGWRDVIHRWFGEQASDAERTTRWDRMAIFPNDLDHVPDYESIIRAIAELGDLSLDKISCKRSGRAVAVRLRLGGQSRHFTQDGLSVDLEQLLPALNALHSARGERYWEFGHHDFGEEFGVAFGDRGYVKHLRGEGYKVMIRDAC